jgi:DNA replication protein DnaC
MALIGKIRGMRMRDGKSISEISRLTSLSRNTIKKWLRTPQGAVPKYRRSFEGSPVERKLIHTLAEMAFTEPAQNVVLVGGPGTGKTHLATAIGVSGVTRHGRRVRFYSTVDLVNALEREGTR